MQQYSKFVVIAVGAAMAIVHLTAHAVAGDDISNQNQRLEELVERALKSDIDSLELRDVSRSRVTIDGEDRLVVEGRIFNTADHPRSVPTLRITISDKSGKQLRSWTVKTRASTVAAKGEVDFRAEKSGIPESASEVSVTFVRNRDMGETRASDKKPGRWVDLPDKFRGLWSSEDCSSGSDVLALTGFGIATVFSDGDMVLSKRFLSVSRHGAGSIDYRTEGAVESHRMSVAGGRLSFRNAAEESKKTELRRCDRVPSSLVMLHGEGLNGLLGVDRVLSACRSNSKDGCSSTAVQFAVVSGNGKLSVAEVSRVLRIMFYAGTVFGDDTATFAEDLVGPMLVSYPLTPMIVELVMASVDYDADGQLSLNELMQDRGQLNMGDVEHVGAALPSRLDIQDFADRMKGLLGVLRQ